MQRRLRYLYTILTLAALFSFTLADPTAALADGAMQISGVSFPSDLVECDDPQGAGADFAIRMTGDLVGCHYVFVEFASCSAGGVYLETGTETFVDADNSANSFRTFYRFEAKFNDCANLLGQAHGRCQHPIIAGSGEGYFEGVSGRLDFRDDIEAGNFVYRGHLKW